MNKRMPEIEAPIAHFWLAAYPSGEDAPAPLPFSDTPCLRPLWDANRSCIFEFASADRAAGGGIGA